MNNLANFVISFFLSFLLSIGVTMIIMAMIGKRRKINESDR